MTKLMMMKSYDGKDQMSRFHLEFEKQPVKILCLLFSLNFLCNNTRRITFYKTPFQIGPDRGNASIRDSQALRSHKNVRENHLQTRHFS